MSASKSKIVLAVRTLRMYQWTKNLLVLAALIFAEELGDLTHVTMSLLAFAAFCLASSGTYLFNDLMDIEKDRAHPKKRLRPLPSGDVSVATAWTLLVVLFAGAAALGWTVGLPFLIALGFYAALTISYSLVLKKIVLIDVIVIAIGFVTRAMAGALAVDVEFSNWLVVCTLFLALFLALNKRRNEIALLDSAAATHRRVHDHYSVSYLDHLSLIVAAGTLITYTIYTCSPEVVQRLGTDKLYFTIPFVVYGLFRYLFLVDRHAEGGDPSDTLLKDWPLGLTVALWGLTCVAIIYL